MGKVDIESVSVSKNHDFLSDSCGEMAIYKLLLLIRHCRPLSVGCGTTGPSRTKSAWIINFVPDDQ